MTTNDPSSPSNSFPLKVRDFESQIAFFNGMYKLPIASFPTVEAVAIYQKDADLAHAIYIRLRNFKVVLLEEVEEVEEIITKMDVDKNYKEIDVLVDLADWLGDIQVYCASEMAKFGLPLKEILSIIMSSNFSKLGADGTPIMDTNGKVLKGPGYWKPEPQIRKLLEERIAEANSKENLISITWTDADILNAEKDGTDV